ncbi:penicillin-binding protein 2 [Candidatus Gottesmanbacteria bacterium]|nr:penicillin-binding protein 2 [Candidatus Gottesmanbacteria bacterium]
MELRLKFLFIFFVLVFIIITGRLFYWQIILSDRLEGEADTQRTKLFQIPAKRGTIMAQDGSLLVANQRAYLVYAEPRKIKNMTNTQDLLADILDLDAASISGKFRNESLAWIPIAHKVEEEKKQMLQTKNLPGIGFEEEGLRYYPESSMAAHILGFVGKDAKGDDKGYFGIEGFYDRQLKGRTGSMRQETDARGLPILIGKQTRIEPENGRDLILHIDKSVQFIIEKKLEEAINKYGAKGGWVVVMEPKTGSILGMASSPAYEPKKYGTYDNSLYKNPIVAESYEPGSTFKVLVMGAALKEKKVKPSQEFIEEGPIEIGGYQIRTWNNQYSGKITATGILEKSSNVGMVMIGKLLGKDKLIQYIKKFGIDRTTGIDLEEEVSADLRPENSWYDIDYATASFGQGIAVTAIQMIRAVSAIANDGILVEPHMVKTIVNPDGRKIDIRPKIIDQVISKEAAHVLSEMMVQAVDHGEARYSKPKGYKIAGKTGTAQIPIAGHYDATKTIASFVGFAPVPNPQFVMLTTLKEPTSSPWGSETAAPLFFSIARELFSYYGIRPSQ